MEKLLRQTDMMAIANSMQPGFCFMINNQQMRRLAEGSLRSAFDGPVRREDIMEFVRQTTENWDVTWHEDQRRGSWTMRKNGEIPEDPLAEPTYTVPFGRQRYIPPTLEGMLESVTPESRSLVEEMWRKGG